MNDKYYLTLDKENASIVSWKDNFFDIKDMVEIVWSGKCSEEEAMKHFNDLVDKQSEQLHVLKTIPRGEL